MDIAMEEWVTPFILLGRRTF